MLSYFPDRMKYLRDEKGWTQEELGRRLGVSKVSICWYEGGARIPSLENTIKMAAIFEVSLDFLLGIDYVDELQPKNDEFIIRTIKRSNYLYRFILDNPRNAVDKLEKYAKKE